MIRRTLIRATIGAFSIPPAVLMLPACMTVSDSQPVVHANNPGQLFAGKRIALLPIKVQSSLAPDSVQGMRIEVSKRLADAMKVKLQSAVIVDIASVVDQLNQKNLLPVFEQLIQTYENTGILDRQKISALARALGSDYLVLSRLKAEKMDLMISKGTGGSLDISLINGTNSEVSWGGSGEWKRGGIFGFGGSTAEEAAVGLITNALASLR